MTVTPEVSLTLLPAHAKAGGSPVSKMQFQDRLSPDLRVYISQTHTVTFQTLEAARSVRGSAKQEARPNACELQTHFSID